MPWNDAGVLQLSWAWRRQLTPKEFGQTLPFSTQGLKSGNKNKRIKLEPEVEIAE